MTTKPPKPDENQDPLSVWVRARRRTQNALFACILGNPGAEQIDIIGDETVVGAKEAMNQGTAPKEETP